MLILYLQKSKGLPVLFLLLIPYCARPPVTPEIPSTVSIKQGIKGKVVFKEGLFSSDGELEGNGKIYAAERTIYIYEMVSLSEIEMAEGDFIQYISKSPIDTARSDEHGLFQIELPPGRYSIVIDENNRLYSKVNTEDLLMPIVVEENKVTDVLIEIDYKATY